MRHAERRMIKAGSPGLPEARKSSERNMRDAGSSKRKMRGVGSSVQKPPTWSNTISPARGGDEEEAAGGRGAASSSLERCLGRSRASAGSHRLTMPGAGLGRMCNACKAHANAGGANRRTFKRCAFTLPQQCSQIAAPAAA
jgi:hypothetical protein